MGIFWRTVSTNWAHHHLKGKGAAEYPGRWNIQDEFVVYLSSTPSLAMLETLVHLTPTIDVPGQVVPKFPPRLMLQIEVSDEFIIRPQELFDDIEYLSDPHLSQQYGSDWYRLNTSLALKVPSIIVPPALNQYEYNLVLNSDHPEAGTHADVVNTCLWHPDPRLNTQNE